MSAHIPHPTQEPAMPRPTLDTTVTPDNADDLPDGVIIDHVHDVAPDVDGEIVCKRMEDWIPEDLTFREWIDSIIEHKREWRTL